MDIKEISSAIKNNFSCCNQSVKELIEIYDHDAKSRILPIGSSLYESILRKRVHELMYRDGSKTLIDIFGMELTDKIYTISNSSDSYNIHFNDRLDSRRVFDLFGAVSLEYKFGYVSVKSNVPKNIEGIHFPWHVKIQIIDIKSISFNKNGYKEVLWPATEKELLDYCTESISDANEYLKYSRNSD